MKERFTKPVKNAAARVRELGWPGVRRVSVNQVKYWYRLFRQTWRLFRDNRGPYQANALAYRTMVSLVPMLAFMLSLLALMMGRGMGDLKDKLKDIISDYVVPNSSIVDDALGIVQNIVEQAQGGTIIGFIILLFTSIFLINAIEQIFNNLWHITRRRPYSWRVLSYTALIVLIPVLLGVSIFMTAENYFDLAVQALRDVPVINQIPLITWAWNIAQGVGIPLATVWMLFMAMYKWMPNTKVETTSAAYAAIVAAIAFEICKWGFSLFATEMVVRRRLWWGPIGGFLVFLMWVYLIWWIILFCAQLAYVIQNYRYVLKRGWELEGRVGIAFIATHVMLETARRHVEGEQPPTVRELAEKLEVEVPRVQEVITRLLDANLIILAATSEKERDKEVYVPGRDIGRITLSEVIRAVTDIWQIPVSFHRDHGHGMSDAEIAAAASERPEDALEELLRKSRSEVNDTLNVSIRQMLEPGSAS